MLQNKVAIEKAKKLHSNLPIIEISSELNPSKTAISTLPLKSFSLSEPLRSSDVTVPSNAEKDTGDLKISMDCDEDDALYDDFQRDESILYKDQAFKI